MYRAGRLLTVYEADGVRETVNERLLRARGRRAVSIFRAQREQVVRASGERNGERKR